MGLPASIRPFNAQLIGLSPRQREQRYLSLARAALAHYALDVAQPIFLQHNSGVAFHVESADRAAAYLLKIHEPVGTGRNEAAASIEARLAWLADLRRITDLVVQAPVPNCEGRLLTTVVYPDLPEPFICTLQHWVAGEPPGGDFTLAQIYRVGALLAKLHDGGRHLVGPYMDVLPRFDARDMLVAVAALQPAVDAGWLTPGEFATVEVAGQHMAHRLHTLARDEHTWGPIHGDLHHDNLVFSGDDARPIDFDSLHIAPYYLDLGTTLYYIHYQGSPAARTLLAGYESVCVLPPDHQQYLDTALTCSALRNLAFQITIPQQHTSAGFVRNLRQLANEFCYTLLQNQSIVHP